MPFKPITPQQLEFCRQVSLGKNYTQAYLAAYTGATPKTASSNGYLLARRPHLKQKIDELCNLPRATMVLTFGNATTMPTTFQQTEQGQLQHYQQQAQEGLRNYILDKNPYQFQDIVAGLLSAMGYFISMVSPKGRDGGIDIIAYTDPLGTKPPRIIVQVKHTPFASISSDDIQRLSGTMKRDGDVGVFVTSGDFSPYAKAEARSSAKHIELIDFDRFIELWIQHYNKMNHEVKALFPLQPVYFLGSNQ